MPERERRGHVDQVFPSACNDIRLVGQDIYTRRANGDVVPVTVSR